MRHIAIFLIGLLAFPAYSEVKVDLFDAEIVLDEADTQAENTAKSAGLQQVVVRASGDKNAATNPVVVKALRKSGQYLSQISYGDQFGLRSLKMVFNPPQIQSLLMQANLPYWSENRANLVVWIVEESRYGREILWEQSGSSSMNQLKYFADLRGLPVTIPVGDIDDVTGITAPELWGGFVSPISSASLRYPGDAVLVIRIQRAVNRSSIRWTLYDEKPEFMFASNRDPLTGSASGETHVALESVIDEISNYYATKSAVRNSGELTGTVSVQFLNITSANRFFALEKMLKAQNSVASLNVQYLVGSDVTFKINLLSSREEFEAEVIQNDSLRKFSLGYEEAPSVISTPDINTDVVQSGELVTEQGSVIQPLINSSNDISSGYTAAPVTGISTETALESEELSNINKPLVFEWVD